MYKKCAEHSVFGAAAKLPKQQIPTYEDIFKAYSWSLKTDDIEPKLMFKRVKMLAKVKDDYTKASIPPIGLQSIAVSIQRLTSKACKLEKKSKHQQRLMTITVLFKNCLMFLLVNAMILE